MIDSAKPATSDPGAEPAGEGVGAPVGEVVPAVTSGEPAKDDSPVTTKGPSAFEGRTPDSPVKTKGPSAFEGRTPEEVVRAHNRWEVAINQAGIVQVVVGAGMLLRLYSRGLVHLSNTALHALAATVFLVFGVALIRRARWTRNAGLVAYPLLLLLGGLGSTPIACLAGYCLLATQLPPSRRVLTEDYAQTRAKATNSSKPASGLAPLLVVFSIPFLLAAGLVAFLIYVAGGYKF